MRSAELHLITASPNFWLSDPGQVTSPHIPCFPIRKRITIKSLYPRVWWWLKWQITCENISWTAKCDTNMIMIIVTLPQMHPSHCEACFTPVWAYSWHQLETAKQVITSPYNMFFSFLKFCVSAFWFLFLAALNLVHTWLLRKKK